MRKEREDVIERELQLCGYFAIRKILNYKTPEEYFDTELDCIYRRR
ncbi:hypothetical protein ACIA31_08830 [Lactobacillus delbrueckii subsp. bulgaricus]